MIWFSMSRGLAQIFKGPRCRFPIQLELLQPAELADKMCALAPGFFL